MKQVFYLLLFVCGIGNGFCQIPISDISHTENNWEDLKFLKKELVDKNIICLGEEWHFTETFSQTKNRLVKYLHQELGYNVMLFESSFQGAWIAESENLEGKERLFETVQTIWRTESVLNLMNYISESKKGANPITQYGIDLYGPYTNKFRDKLTNYLNSNLPHLKDIILSAEANIQEAYLAHHRDQRNFKSKVTREGVEQYKSLLATLDKDSSTFSSKEDKEYFIHVIKNRTLLGEEFLMNDTYFREKVMSDNIKWILNRIGENDKVIIWAADIHISKSQKKTIKTGDKSMIERLPDNIKNKVYSLSLIPINSAPKKMRKELIAKKDRFFFFDLSEENKLSKRKDEFNGMIICKDVESIENYKIK